MGDFGGRERREENEGDIDMVTATGRDNSARRSVTRRKVTKI